MKYGTELFRIDKWVLRARRDERCMILHECKEKSTNYTLSGVYHLPLLKPGSDCTPWMCKDCKQIAVQEIVTVWLMLNWEELHGNI